MSTLVPRFKLSPRSPEVSALAYGVWRLGDDPAGADVARVRAKIDACLEVGITTFDHADIYGGYTCEGLFGKALAEVPALRDRMEIITKCGIQAPCEQRPSSKVKHYDATARYIGTSVDRSLKELHTDRIDVLLIHRPDCFTSAEDTARGLLSVVQSGKVRSVGVSNYTTHQSALLAKHLGHTPVTNQIEISLLRMDAIYDGTLDQCQLHDSHPIAWSPLAGGRLFTGADDAAVRTRAALAEIAQAHAATPDQIALAWVAALPCAPQVVIGTNNIDRIHAAAAAARITLERQQWYQLWEAAQGTPVP